MASRKYNHSDKNGEFYKVEKEGKEMYARQYQLTIDGVKQPPRWSPYFSTTKKVMDFINDEKAEARKKTGIYKSLSKHTFDEVYEQCYENMVDDYKMNNKSPRTLNKFSTNIEKYVIGRDKSKLTYSGLGGKYVEELTIMDVKNLKADINTVYGATYSKDTIKHIFGHIDKVFAFARDNGWVTHEFYSNIHVSAVGSKQKSKQAVRNFFSEKEYRLFREIYDKNCISVFSSNFNNCPLNKSMKDQESVVVKFRCILYRTLFSFIFYTGSRKGESRGCKWSDIIPSNDIIDLQCIKLDSQYAEDYAYLLDKEVHEKPKTDDSVRICLIHEQLEDDLAQLKEFLIKYKLFNPNQYIFFDFFSTTPKPIPTTNINRYFNLFKKLAKIEENSVTINGIERNITVHGMRHSACAMLLEKGMDKEDIAKFLGHKDTKMINEVYMHYVNPIDMEEERRKRNLQFFRK